MGSRSSLQEAHKSAQQRRSHHTSDDCNDGVDDEGKLKPGRDKGGEDHSRNELTRATNVEHANSESQTNTKPGKN